MPTSETKTATQRADLKTPLGRIKSNISTLASIILKPILHSVRFKAARPPWGLMLASCVRLMLPIPRPCIGVRSPGRLLRRLQHATFSVRRDFSLTGSQTQMQRHDDMHLPRDQDPPAIGTSSSSMLLRGEVNIFPLSSEHHRIR